MNDFSYNQNGFNLNNAVRLPSAVYAEAPHASRSDQFKHIPTIVIVENMAKAGFVPVRSSARNVRNPDKQGFQKHVIRFRRESEANLRMTSVGETVSEIALEAANNTSRLLPKIGRARTHGEKSLGHPDPGSISFAYICNAVGLILKKECRVH